MGFSIRTEYPTRFLRAEELNGKHVDVKIKTVKKEKVFKNNKNEDALVVYFEGKDRGVCLGKSRARDIAAIYGDDTDGWVGGVVRMYTEKMNAFGKNIDVIRFRIAK